MLFTAGAGLVTGVRIKPALANDDFQLTQLNQLQTAILFRA